MLKVHASMLILLASFVGNTASASTYEAQAFSDSTTDEISQTGLSLHWNQESESSTLDGQVWEYGISTSLITGAGTGYDFLGRRLAVEATWKLFETLRLNVAMGVHHLQSVYDLKQENQTLIPFEFGVWLQPLPTFSTSLKLQRDFVYDDTLFQPAGVLSQMKAWSVISESEFALTSSVRADLKAGWRFFNNSDQGRSVDAAVFWHTEWDKVKLAAGAGSETISFTQPSADYWAPGIYQSVGPRIEASFLIYRTLELTADAQVYRFMQDLLPDEDRVFWSNGVYTHVDLRLGSEDQLNLHLIYELNSSGQENETWSRQRLALQAMASF